LTSLFEPFFQVQEHRFSSHAGTGLGLSIVKRLVNLMGGKIKVISEEGKGSSFQVTVDFKTNVNDANITNTEALLDESAESLRILIVEEDDSLTSMLKNLLAVKLNKPKIDCVTSGQEAIELANNHSYDIILMDYQLSNMNGADVTLAIRETENEHQSIIIAITAEPLPDKINTLKLAGIDAVIAKPFSSHEVMSAMAQIIPCAA